MDDKRLSCNMSSNPDSNEFASHNTRRCLKLRKSLNASDRARHMMARMLSRRQSSLNAYGHNNIITQSMDSLDRGDIVMGTVNMNTYVWSDLEPEIAALGQGAFGRVSLVRDKASQRLMVMKECLDNTPENYEVMMREFSLLHSVNHENVLQFIGVLLKAGRLCLLVEYVPGGDLHTRLYADVTKELPWSKRIGFAKDIAAGMEYLHDSQIVHRDLNSHNILIREDDTAVVADFGLSKLISLSKRDLQKINESRVSSSSSSSSERNGEEHHIRRCDCEREKRKPGWKWNQFAAKRVIKSRDSSTDVTYRRQSNKFKSTSTSATECSTQVSQESQNVLINQVSSGPKVKYRRCRHVIMEEGVNNPENEIDEVESEPEIDLRRRYSIVGNPFWMAPEMLAHKPYDRMVDVYSYGTILCELWIRRVDLKADDLPRRYDDMAIDWPQVENLIPSCCPPMLVELTARCCESESSQRPSFRHICDILVRASIAFNFLSSGAT